jgi:amino acid adenylation domain-containing protein
MEIIYNSKLFLPQTLERLCQHYLLILDQVLSNTGIKISEIQVMTEEEKHQLLTGWTESRDSYPIETLIHPLFEQQVRQTPNLIAAASTVDIINLYDKLKPISQDIEISYIELNNKSNQWARELRSRGVTRDSIVGILVQHPLEMVIGIWAVLKAGAAFLPIDPKYPEKLKKYILEDSSVSLVISEASLAQGLLTLNPFLSVITGEDNCIYHHSESNLECTGKTTDLAYVIYTSGTTGKPKGVLVEHKGIVNYCLWRIKNYGLSRDEVTLQPLSYCFDGFASNFYSTLISGGTLVIIPESRRQDVDYIKDVIKGKKITNVSLVPGIYHLILDNASPGDLESLKFVVLGGEKSSANLIKRSQEKVPQVLLINEYGPTEASVTAAGYQGMNQAKTACIGQPIANTRLYVYDRSLQLVPTKLPGELAIAGIGVARGYLNRPELTAGKFRRVANEQWSMTHDRVYLTGDMTRWLPDGNLEFLGRIDQQVKIRGFRIELEEIENHLLKHPQVREAVVQVMEPKPNTSPGPADEDKIKFLCAYIVSQREFPTTELKDHLAGELPEYMIPTHFFILDKIPLNTNGKLDRKALPLPGDQEEYRGPRNEIEKKLVDIWAQVLGLERETIGINSDFFKIGGHSMKATIMISKVHKEFAVTFPFEDFFEKPTIEKISGFITHHGADSDNTAPVINKAKEKEYYALSPIQQRLYIIQQMDAHNKVYSVPMAMVLEGKLHKEKLEETFKKLIQRHESLRTSFETIDQQAFQKINPEVDLSVPCQDAENMDEKEVNDVLNRFFQPLDLRNPPLFRIGLIQLQKERHILMMNIHHFITDATSLAILAKDFMTLYAGEELPPLRLQYKDFSEWQNQLKESGEIKKQEEYWLKEFTGPLPVLNLPIDYPETWVQSFEGNQLRFEINAEELIALKEIAENTGATLFMTLLALVNIFLAKICGQEDIIVGSTISGRKYAHLDQVVGPFLNTLALRNSPSGDKIFYRFLEEVKERTLKAYENQDYQLEELVEKVVTKRGTQRNPLFNTLFVLNNTDIPELKLPGLTLKPYEYQSQTADADLSLLAAEREQKMIFTFSYRIRLFKEATIKRWIDYFKQAVTSVIQNPDNKISDIPIIPPAVKREKLQRFNRDLHDRHAQGTIQETLFKSFRRYKDNTAVEYGSQKYTYFQLENRAASVSHWIRENNIDKGSFIGILTENKMDIITAVIGILNTGCVFVPLDTTLPAKRIEKMILTSHIRVIFIDNINRKTLLHHCPVTLEKVKHIILDDSFYQQYAPAASESHKVQYNGEDWIYIYFTSGSTGTPKALLGRNKSLLQFIQWEITNFHFDSSYRVSQLVPVGFDAFLRDIFAPLCAGGTICIPEKIELLMNEEKLATWIDQNEITLIHCVPSVFRLFNQNHLHPNRYHHLKYVLISGEHIPPPELKRWYTSFGERIQLVNLYGPSETTMVKTCYFIRESDISKNKIPIGAPIRGTEFIILDKHMNICAPGCEGELFLRTPYMTFGYYNDPQANQERFIPNPFIDNADVTDLIYKTGDLARELADGNIQLQGRVDRQIKIRGIRVEPEEIENKIKHFNRAQHRLKILSNKTAARIQNPDTVVRCRRCILSGNFPGLRFDKDGVCSVCHDYEIYKEYLKSYLKNKEDFINLLKQVKKTSPGASPYDCLLLFSGGKDSSYVLYQLIEMGIRVLTFTFDNGYISAAAFNNIKNITSRLKVENIILKAENINKVFVESLNSEHSVCYGCWHTLHTLAAKIAYERGIKVVVSGLSKGQILDIKLQTFFQAGIFQENEIEEKLQAFMKAIYSPDNKYSRILNIPLPQEAVKQIQFVDFFRYFTTPVHHIKEYLTAKGWTQPEDTGFCSSNCIINDTGIFFHLIHRGYHPYSVPISWDIRLQQLSRQEGLEEISLQYNPETVNRILDEIGFYAASSIKDVTVIEQEDKQKNTSLYAYIVSPNEIPLDEIREYLAGELPEYMIPSYFIQVDKIPLTPTGKVDKKALLQWPGEKLKTRSDYIGPGTEIEKKLVQLWSEVLEMEKDKISINASFFELGGHSLGVLKMISQIKKRFHVEVKLSYIFNHPRIQDISRFITEQEKNPLPQTPQEEIVVTLNQVEGHHKKLFCFPPQVGYGIGYKGLAALLEGYSIYAFNFIQDDNRLKRFVQSIIRIDKNGPYVLLGYSAGGYLAFEVAKELEKNGYPVSDVILIDSFVDRPAIGFKENQQMFAAIEQFIENMGLEFLKESVLEKSQQVTAYIRDLTLKGTINANIHFLSAKNEEKRETTRLKPGTEISSWESFTNKSYCHYQGHGKHIEMFSPGHLEKNAGIIKNILSQNHPGEE